MSRALSFVPHALAIAAAAVLAAAPLAAQAGSVALAANATLGSATGPGTNVMDGNANGGDFFYSDANGTGDSVFFHTYGNASGVTYFGARASGTGTFFANTSATYTDSITNTSGAAQIVSFTFNVEDSEFGMVGDGTGYASLALSLSFGLNGGAKSVVAQDSGRVDSVNGVVSCSTNGAGDTGVLASHLACGSGNFGGAGAATYTVTQLLGAGDTLDLLYSITSETAGTMNPVMTERECSFGAGGGVIEQIPTLNAPVEAMAFAVFQLPTNPGSVGCVDFNGIARSGDPASPSLYTPANFSLSLASVDNTVPEPGTLALAGLALLGAAGLRRRG